MRFRFASVSAICFISAIVLSFVIMPGGGYSQNPRSTPKTLERKYDIVKINGEFVNRFSGVPIDNLALLAYKDGAFAPIPFQIDERDIKSHYIMTSGKAASRDIDQCRLDANDELVFLGVDAGERAPEPERLANGSRIEIELTDTKDKTKQAWAYLAKYPAKAPRSSADYVRYDPAGERIISKYATVGYRKGLMFYNDMSYPASNGGNGQDFLDRIKLRIKVDFLGGKANIVRNEEAISATVQGWIDGPVRIVQLTENKLKILDALPAITFAGSSEYYPHMMSTPLSVSMPFDLNTVAKMFGIKNFKAIVLADMNGFVGGEGHSNLGNVGGFHYTGKSPKSVIDALKTKGIIWGFATKKGVGTWFPRLVFPDPTYQFNHLYMTDDLGLVNPPDDVPGEIGSGMVFDFLAYPKEIIRYIAEGSFELRFETYYAESGLTVEGAREWLDIQDYPLFVEIDGGNLKKEGVTAVAASGPPWKGGRNGVITDVRGTKKNLTRIAFFIGSSSVDPRTKFTGERVTDQTWHGVSIDKIKYLSNRYVAHEPVTKVEMAQFTKIVLTDDSSLDLMGCRMCGWAGADENGRVIYFPNSQVERIDFQ